MALYGVETTITYVAWDTSANTGKTGDAANHTLRWVKDGTSAAPTNSPSEVDATNAPGVYKLTLTSTECQAIAGTLAGKSSTANVSIIPVQIPFERLPNAAPGSANGLPILDADARVSADVTAISGDATAADNAEAMFDGTGYAGGTTKLQVNTVQIEGGDATDQLLTAAQVWSYTTRSLTTFGTLATDVATEVWSAGTRTLTSFGTLVSDIWSYTTRSLTTFGSLASDVATAVWAAGTRTLTSFGTLASDTATAVWAAGTRTLTSFGSLAEDVWGYATRTLTSFGSLAADVWAVATRTITGGTVTSVGSAAVTSSSFATGAITADAIAADAVGADELSEAAIAAIADAVLEEIVAQHKTTAGSLAAIVNQMWRRLGYGAIVTDSDANTIETYDAASASGSPVLTQTGITEETITTWTPS